jgi:hypothetical protein
MRAGAAATGAAGRYAGVAGIVGQRAAAQMFTAGETDPTYHPPTSGGEQE